MTSPPTVPATSATTSLEVRRLTKTFYDVAAIDALSFEVAGGEVHGLLGENGAGKSTLCSVLAGLYRPDAGEIVLDGEPVHFRSPHDAAAHGIGMVYQHFRLVDSFTVAENIVLGMAKSLGRGALRLVERRVGELVDSYGLDIHPSASVWQLSVGEQQRVEIVKQLIRGARFLILDEPTAVLAPQETDRLFEAVRQMVDGGHAVVVVSHKLQEILDNTDRVTVLRDGRNAGNGKTAELTSEALSRMVFGERQVERAQVVTAPHQPGDVVLSVTDLVVRGDRGTAAVDGVSFEVRRGEILGVAGVAGNGQRELQEAIGGLRPGHGGEVRIGTADSTRADARQRAAAGLAYVPEDRLGTGLAPGLTLEENLVIKRFDQPPCSRAGVLSSSVIASVASELTARFDLRSNQQGMPVSFMSGGNLQKAILARELTADHDVLLAAALTRGLDHRAAEAARDLVRAERDSGRGVLLFSEDLGEVLEVSDVVLVMYQGRIVGRFDRDEVDVDEIGLLMTGWKAQ
jgi:simple sugar transport system ATP-binding protein